MILRWLFKGQSPLKWCIGFIYHTLQNEFSINDDDVDLNCNNYHTCTKLTKMNSGDMKYQHTMKNIFGVLPFISLIFLPNRRAPLSIKHKQVDTGSIHTLIIMFLGTFEYDEDLLQFWNTCTSMKEGMYINCLVVNIVV